MTPRIGEYPVLHQGRSLEECSGVMILLHGRGGSAEDMLSFIPRFSDRDFAYLAPQAKSGIWYPFSFLSPIGRNEPQVTLAVEFLARLVAELMRSGIEESKMMILGFSQGACLGLEFVARQPRAYGGVVGLSGGLIGESIDASNYGGSLQGVPVFLGCSDLDPHIPRARVEETAAVFERLGAEVTMKIYANLGHTVNGDETSRVRKMMGRIKRAGDSRDSEID